MHGRGSTLEHYVRSGRWEGRELLPRWRLPQRWLAWAHETEMFAEELFARARPWELAHHLTCARRPASSLRSFLGAVRRPAHRPVVLGSPTLGSADGLVPRDPARRRSPRRHAVPGVCAACRSPSPPCDSSLSPGCARGPRGAPAARGGAARRATAGPGNWAHSAMPREAIELAGGEGPHARRARCRRIGRWRGAKSRSRASANGSRRAAVRGRAVGALLLDQRRARAPLELRRLDRRRRAAAAHVPGTAATSRRSLESRAEDQRAGSRPRSGAGAPPSVPGVRRPATLRELGAVHRRRRLLPAGRARAAPRVRRELGPNRRRPPAGEPARLSREQRSAQPRDGEVGRVARSRRRSEPLCAARRRRSRSQASRRARPLQRRRQAGSGGKPSPAVFQAGVRPGPLARAELLRTPARGGDRARYARSAVFDPVTKGLAGSRPRAPLHRGRGAEPDRARAASALPLAREPHVDGARPFGEAVRRRRRNQSRRGCADAAEATARTFLPPRALTATASTGRWPTPRPASPS